MSDEVGDLRARVLGRNGDVPESLLERLVEARNVDELCEELRALDREIGRRLEEGSIPAERAAEARSRLSRAALDLSRLAADREVRAYRQFLRDVSHDIRSPLHSIIFLTEALYSSRQEGRPEAEQRQLGTIYAAGTSLLNLVNDLLDYARIQQGEVEEVAEYAFSLSSVLSDVRQLLGPLVQHHGTELTVTCEDGGRFVGDPHLLNRVLTNLVSNAIEASAPEGRVAFRLERSGGGLRGEVLDDGEEADVEKLRTLLDVPAENAPMARIRRELDGSVHGLGLMICGRLIRQVDGWIDVDAVGPGEDGGDGGVAAGTRFTFWLPFTAEAAES